MGPGPGQGQGPGAGGFQDFFSGGFGGAGGASGGGGGFMGMGLDDILQALRGKMSGGQRRRAPRAKPDLDIQKRVMLDFLKATLGTTVPVVLTRSGGGKKETIEVKIPPGVTHGAKIRVRGKGSSHQGVQGDLYILVSVTPHPYFIVSGNDITVDVPISLTEAALGAKVDIPTIDGMTTVTIPPGTSSGQRLRLKGKGVPTKSGRGDQFVLIRIVVGKHISGEGRKLLEEYQACEQPNARKDCPWA